MNIILKLLIPLLLCSCSYKLIKGIDRRGKTVLLRHYKDHERNEEYRNTKNFRANYSNMQFDTYKGLIIKDTVRHYTYYQFDTARIYLSSYPIDGNEGLKYACLVESGLLSPALIACALHTSCAIPQDSVHVLHRVADVNFNTVYPDVDTSFLRREYNWLGPKVCLSMIKELPYLEKATTRVFELEHKIYLGDPTNAVYFIEITNEAATAKTPLPEFVKGARLSFLKYIWLYYEI